jgi:hypothetical protein
MPTTLPSQRGIDSAAARAMPTADATLHLSAHTLSWLAKRPVARALVDSVWNTLTEQEAAGSPVRLVAALRFVLTHHQPTPAGRCRACRRMSWRGLWRRRRFPCLVWRQIRGELLGHLTISGFHRRAGSDSLKN